MHGDAWGFPEEDRSFSVGTKKMKKSVWGMRGDVSTQISVPGDYPHTKKIVWGVFAWVCDTGVY